MSNQGIDIRQALDILSARSSHDHSHSHSGEQAGCQSSATEESKTMGQMIDLSASGKSPSDPKAVAKSMEEQKQQLDHERKTREEQIRAELQTMTVKDLLQAVMEAQRERVATYRAYDGYVPSSCCVMASTHLCSFIQLLHACFFLLLVVWIRCYKLAT